MPKVKAFNLMLIVSSIDLQLLGIALTRTRMSNIFGDNHFLQHTIYDYQEDDIYTETKSER